LSHLEEFKLNNENFCVLTEIIYKMHHGQDYNAINDCYVLYTIHCVLFMSIFYIKENIYFILFVSQCSGIAHHFDAAPDPTLLQSKLNFKLSKFSHLLLNAFLFI
jgi:hypothetical protein